MPRCEHNTLFGGCRYFAALAALIVAALCMNVRVYAAPTVTIVIDPGHGGRSEDGDETNSGCKYHGLEEKTVNLITALAMYDELTQYGNVEVYLTRDSDIELSLSKRVESAQEVGADVLISIHYNASEEHNFFGSEIFTSAYGECYGLGHALGEQIMDEWVLGGNIPKDVKTRIGKKGDYYGLIRNGHTVGIPTIILEHGYLDNDKDYERIKTDAAWKKFGVMDATAVAKFYGLEKNVVKENIGPEIELENPKNPVMPDDTAPEDVRLEIDDYDSKTGDIEFTLTAKDDESKLMYYGFVTGDVGEDTVFTELELWDGVDGELTGKYHVEPGYEGPLTAKVYNVYQLDTISNTAKLEAAEEEEEEESVEEPVQETDEDDGSWMIGGTIPAADASAAANAVDKNTQSSVKNSYTAFLIAGLVGAVTLAVAVTIAISVSMEKKRAKKNKGKGRQRDVFDWADKYEK